jgi:hypothetical protein
MAGILPFAPPAGQVGVQVLTTSGRVDRLTTTQALDFSTVSLGTRLA